MNSFHNLTHIRPENAYLRSANVPPHFKGRLRSRKTNLRADVLQNRGSFLLIGKRGFWGRPGEVFLSSRESVFLQCESYQLGRD